MKLPKYVKDITGQRFGRLTALEFSHIDERSKTAMWKFRCDCGVEFVTYGTHVRAGKTRSCGCLRTEESKRRMGKMRDNWVIPVAVIKDGVRKEFPSISEAAKYIGVVHATIRIAVHNEQSFRGYTFEKLNKNQ